MQKTYSKIYLHFVFTVKYRENLLKKEWRDELFKYMAGIVKAKNQIPIIINGVENHVHMLVAIRPNINISDFIRDVKNNSSKYINETKCLSKKFFWQEGFGVFSYHQSMIDVIQRYIENQEEHHRKKDFKDEYIGFLKEFNVDFDENRLFQEDNDARET
jgi:putative transposase